MSVRRSDTGKAAGGLWLAATLAVAAALLAVVWGAPRVSASAARWMAAPPTKARLVKAPLPVEVGGASGALQLGASGPLQLRASGGAARAASPAIDAGLRFNMLGVLLKSARPYDPDLVVRVRTSLDGETWSGWTKLAFVRSEGTPGSAFDPKDTCSQPLWVGEARYVQYTLGLASGAEPVGVGDVRFSFINTLGDADAADTVVSTLKRGLSFVAGIGRVTPALSLAGRPPIVTRAQWGADESLRSGSPSYATLRMAFIHHTAGGNSYTRTQAAGVVRGIYYYHTRSLGWSDIGYNFLVDRYGTIYEGRYGGMNKGVVGAQVLGFNTHSFGVSVMGNFDLAPPPGAAVYALEKLLAWRLDVAHLNPLGKAVMTCSTSDRFRAGQTVTLPVIAAHRDANYTTCPGSAFYATIGEIRKAVAQRGQPKIYAPSSSATAFSPNGDGAGEKVTLSAVLSERADWTVDVKDGGGAVVRHFAGQGTAIAAVWNGRDEDGLRVPDGAYTAVMKGSNDHGVTRSASVGVRVDTVAPEVSAVAAQRVVSPNGDGLADSTLIAYALGEAGSVRVRIYDGAGTLVRTLLSGAWQSSGDHTVKWDGRVSSASGLTPAVSGTYTVRVRDTDAAKNSTVGEGSVKVNLTLGFPKASPLYFSPNGDGTLDTTRLGFTLTRAATVKVVVKGASGAVQTFALGSLTSGKSGVVWKGDGDASVVPGGRYTFSVTASNGLGSVTVSAPVYVDCYVPRPRLPADFSVKYGTKISVVYSVKDPVTNSVHVRCEIRTGKGVLLKTTVPRWVSPGDRHRINYRPPRRRTYVFTLFAKDHAGNAAAPVSVRVRVL
jgi:flagellar hook assembly protein FlgD